MDLQDIESKPMNPTITVPHHLRNLIVGVCLLAITTYWAIGSLNEGSLLHGARMWSRPYTSTLSGSISRSHNAASYDDDTCTLHDPNEDPLPAIRTEFGEGGTIVYGWPSTGGIWVHEPCYGIELEFLGLSRFEISATERFSAEEDAFCERLEWIGGEFYESELIYNRKMSTYHSSRSWYGWPGAVPAGGVWALWTGEGDTDGAVLGVSRIRDALTMEERCEAIEMLGGRFYARWEDVAEGESHRENETRLGSSN